MSELTATERRRWLMVECGACGRLIPLPADWRVTEYLCFGCRARMQEGQL